MIARIFSRDTYPFFFAQFFLLDFLYNFFYPCYNKNTKTKRIFSSFAVPCTPILCTLYPKKIRTLYPKPCTLYPEKILSRTLKRYNPYPFEGTLPIFSKKKKIKVVSTKKGYKQQQQRILYSHE